MVHLFVFPLFVPTSSIRAVFVLFTSYIRLSVSAFEFMSKRNYYLDNLTPFTERSEVMTAIRALLNHGCMLSQGLESLFTSCCFSADDANMTPVTLPLTIADN